MGSRGEKSIWERKKEKGLDRVELRSWMENAPRNIPGIVWEQFSRQPRNDVSFPLRYKSPEVAGPQQTATALPRASSTTKKEPLNTRDYQQTHQERQDDWASEGIPKGFLRRQTYTFPKKLGPGFLLKTQKKIYPRCWCLLLSLPSLGASMWWVFYFWRRVFILRREK